MAAAPSRPAVRVDECFSALVDRSHAEVVGFLDSEEYKQAWITTQCASSAPLSPANWPRVAHSKVSLKAHVRHWVAPSVRKALWQEMASVTVDDSVLFAKAFGEPADDGMLGGDGLGAMMVCGEYVLGPRRDWRSGTGRRDVLVAL